MREDAARVQRAEDYEFLRERARAHLGGGAAEAPGAASRRGGGNVRVISSSPVAEAEPSGYAPPASPPSGPARAAAPRSYGSRTGAPPRAEPRPRDDAPRRTVVITGQPSPLRRRSPGLARVAAEPDRTALWAVMLGIFLALIAVATAHAAPAPIDSHGHAPAIIRPAAAPPAR